MSTDKLYYDDPYMRCFTARVTGCVPVKDGYSVTLDRTAFYPEGGGQPFDLGTINGAAVLGVHEKNGEISHVLSGAMEVGQTVTGEVNWKRRFDLMQQHSGEHIVSGMICSRFGCDNVGFHIGSDSVTIDFNCLPEDRELREIEAAANAYIWEDHETEIFYPSSEELEALEYRSKKALSGAVRIVRFPGADTCACCGTHVRRSGEVGLVKFLDWRKFREGIRIEMVCGGRALRRFNAIETQNREISVLLSAKPLETAPAAGRLLEEKNALQFRLYGMEQKAFEQTAEQLSGKGSLLLFSDGLSADSLRRLAAAVLEKCGGVCAVFSGEDGSYKYAVGMPDAVLRETLKEMNAALHGHGGGKNGFAQGAVEADRKEIEAFFAARGIIVLE